MFDRFRRPARLVVALAVAITLAACSTTSPSSPPPASSTPAASAIPVPTVAPSPTSAATPTTAPTPTPAAPTPTTVPTPSTAEACPVAPQTGRLPSDRMTDVRISSSDDADVVTFVFGNMSVPEPPQGTSEGSLDAAVPPYTEAASGLPIEIDGDHVVQVRFAGMSLMNDVGEPTYDGPMMFSPDLPALRTVANFDMSEGVVGWYIGYDGDGCVSLTSDARSVTVVIDHARGLAAR